MCCDAEQVSCPQASGYPRAFLVRPMVRRSRGQIIRRTRRITRMTYRAVVCQGEDTRLYCGAEQAMRRQALGLPRALLVCPMIRRCCQTDNTQDRADAHVMYWAAVCLLRRISWCCAPRPWDYPERSSFDQWSGMVSGQRIRRQVPPERSLCGNDRQIYAEPGR